MAFVFYCIVLYELKQYESSITAIMIHRTYPGIYCHIAKSYIALKDYDNALLTMERAMMFETNWDEKNKELVAEFYKEVINLKALNS